MHSVNQRATAHILSNQIFKTLFRLTTVNCKYDCMTTDSVQESESKKNLWTSTVSRSIYSWSQPNLNLNYTHIETLISFTFFSCLLSCSFVAHTRDTIECDGSRLKPSQSNRTERKYADFSWCITRISQWTVGGGYDVMKVSFKTSVNFSSSLLLLFVFVSFSGAERKWKLKHVANRSTLIVHKPQTANDRATKYLN